MTIQKLTRKKLIELYKAFDCGDWKNRIKTYLDTTSIEDDDFLINLKQEDIQYAINNATKEQKTKLKKAGVKLESNDLLSQKWTMDKVWAKLGLNPEEELPWDEDLKLTKKQKAVNAFIKIGYISDVFNEGWIPDFTNVNQYKYYIWWKRNSSGSGWSFDCVGSYFYYGFCGLGFYFKDQKTATFIASTFPDIFNDYLPE